MNHLRDGTCLHDRACLSTLRETLPELFAQRLHPLLLDTIAVRCSDDMLRTSLMSDLTDSDPKVTTCAYNSHKNGFYRVAAASSVILLTVPLAVAARVLGFQPLHRAAALKDLEGAFSMPIAIVIVAGFVIAFATS